MTAMDQLLAAANAAGVDLVYVPDAVPPDEHEVQRQEAEIARKQQRALMLCAECDERIDVRDPNVLREVTGWSRHRDQGGQNHVIARRETGRLMCGACAARLRAGLSAHQESLL
jgi:transcription elongation factor Elf1